MVFFMVVGVVHEDVEHQAPEKLRLLAANLLCGRHAPQPLYEFAGSPFTFTASKQADAWLAGHLRQVQACVGMLIKGWTPDWHFSR